MSNKKICPKCGKPVVDTRKYANGDILYVHTRKLVRGPLLHYDVTDSCFVPAKKVKG